MYGFIASNPWLYSCTVDRFTKNFFWKFKKWIVNSMEDYQIKHVRIFFWSQMSLLHKVLDPPSYTRDLQRAKFWKSILGHNFWMECPMDLNSTPLSYIFNALFRDTPLAHLLLRHVCHVCHICHVTCVIYVTCETLRKVGKWGIPEKSIKNVGQRQWPEIRRTLQLKVMAKIDFCIYIPLYFTLWAKKKHHVFRTSFRPNSNVKMSQMTHKSGI